MLVRETRTKAQEYLAQVLVVALWQDLQGVYMQALSLVLGMRFSLMIPIRQKIGDGICLSVALEAR